MLVFVVRARDLIFYLFDLSSCPAEGALSWAHSLYSENGPLTDWQLWPQTQATLSYLKHYYLFICILQFPQTLRLLPSPRWMVLSNLSEIQLPCCCYYYYCVIHKSLLTKTASIKYGKGVVGGGGGGVAGEFRRNRSKGGRKERSRVSGGTVGLPSFPFHNVERLESNCWWVPPGWLLRT